MTASRRPAARVAIALCVALGAIGCSALPPVAPWQKGDLARPEMGFDANALERKFAEQVHSSKEASSGGLGVGGGGCGCN